MSEWQPIDTAPTDGTPFFGYCPDGIERPGYNDPPKDAQKVGVVWNGYPNPDQPRKAEWVCADVQVEAYCGSEWTGSWNEYEFTSVSPTHWLPIPAFPIG